jgi:hypothetical protein
MALTSIDGLDGVEGFAQLALRACTSHATQEMPIPLLVPTPLPPQVRVDVPRTIPASSGEYDNRGQQVRQWLADGGHDCSYLGVMRT